MRSLRLRQAIAVFSLVSALAGAAAAKTPPAPATAPGFTLPTRGQPVSLDSLRGKVVLLDFWASWCVPCRKSFPWMNTLNERYGKRGLVIVAVNLDKTRDPALTFLESVPASFTVAFDSDGKLAEAYHVKAMPTTYLISTDGKILESHAGFDPRHTTEIETMIAEALPK
jgi:thiol-disulfide isomerase/thioredoxin